MAVNFMAVTFRRRGINFLMKQQFIIFCCQLKISRTPAANLFTLVFLGVSFLWCILFDFDKTVLVFGIRLKALSLLRYSVDYKAFALTARYDYDQFQRVCQNKLSALSRRNPTNLLKSNKLFFRRLFLHDL